MKRIHVLGLTLFTVFAASAFVSVSALAASKFLLNGAEIVSRISAESTSELLLEDMGAFGKPDLLCSGIGIGVIEPGGVVGLIEAELTLSKELLEGEVANSDLLECIDDSGTCSGATDIEVLHLPWLTEVMLTAGGLYYVLISNGGSGEPSEVIDCNSILGLLLDTCTPPTGFDSALLTNEPGGVLGELLENETEGISPPGNCTLGGEGQGLQVGSGLITSPSGTLSVSE